VVDVQIGGGKELQEFAKRLEAAAGRGAVLEALAGTMTEALPSVQAAVAGGASRLPHGGGLAELVATTQVLVRLTKSQDSFSARFVAGTNAIADPSAMNRGRVRHPVYGHAPNKIFIQLVPPGFFTEPIKELAPEIRAKLLKAVEDALRKV
jgi:hypothetical protein